MDVSLRLAIRPRSRVRQAGVAASSARRSIAILILTMASGCIDDPQARPTIPTPSLSASTDVPSDWKRIRSEAHGFSLRYPPDWGPRDMETGEFVSVTAACPERLPTKGDAPYYFCSLVPADAQMDILWSFELQISLKKLSPGESAESVSADRTSDDDERITRRRIERFAGQTWSVIDTVAVWPPAGDYGSCRCRGREYYSDDGERLFVFDAVAIRPKEWTRFEDIATQIIHSIRFFP